jgi:hypothetical protein
MGRVSVLLEDMSRNDGFSRFEYHTFCILYPFVTHLITTKPNQPKCKVDVSHTFEDASSVTVDVEGNWKFATLHLQYNGMEIVIMKFYFSAIFAVLENVFNSFSLICNITNGSGR